MEFKQGTKEQLNNLVTELLEKVNNDYQVNIFENELREIINVHEFDYLYSLSIDYTWLLNEKEKDDYNDLSNAVYNEYLETYLN